MLSRICMSLRRFRSVFSVCISVYFSWFLIKGQSLPPSAIAQLHVWFCFPWKNLRLVKTWKWESVRGDKARSYFINPRKPCCQEAGTTATGSEQGDFPPSCSFRMQNNDQILHTHTAGLNVFCVCSYKLAHNRLNLVISDQICSHTERGTGDSQEQKRGV